jgi:hypothetical protein
VIVSAPSDKVQPDDLRRATGMLAVMEAPAQSTTEMTFTPSGIAMSGPT